jgi:THAP4-like, heme-binding beta-barrel domain
MISKSLNINNLFFLVGTWEGKGVAQYPTIKTVEYSERLTFQKTEGFNVLQYEQKTWVKGEKGIYDKPIFWDCGFFIGRENNQIELCSTQMGGRMEILTGKLVRKDKDAFEIIFKSKAIYNDEKMVKSGRTFLLSKSFIKYELWMAITKHPGYDIHLKATLEK